MGISEDLTNLVKKSQNFVRTNQFTVDFGRPSALAGQFDISRIGLSAESCALPGFSIGDYSFNPSGVVDIIMANGHQYSEMNFRFFVSKDLFEHKFFTAWRKCIVTDSNLMGYYDHYKTDVTVNLKKRDKEYSTYNTFRLVDAYLKTLGTVEMSYSDDNNIAMLNASFKYGRFEIVEQ